MHNQSVCRRQLLLHYSVASIDTTLHSQLVGQGERARAAQVAMDALVDRAAERERERDPDRTFAAGLDWFCRHVKANKGRCGAVCSWCQWCRGLGPAVD